MVLVRDIVNEAHRRDRELGPYILKGIRASRRVGFQAMSRSFNAFRHKGDVLGAFERTVAALEPLLRETMITLHLLGMLQVYRGVPKSTSLAETPFAGALAMLRRRVNMDKETFEALAARYGNEAVLVLAKATAATERKLQEAIFRTHAKGMHVREGVVELQKAFEAGGMTSTKSHVLEAVFRTQTQIANSAGQYHAARDPAVDDILWGWRYVAIGDARTRPTHAALNGTTLPKDHPRWSEIFPPNGYNCRCTTIEIFDKPPRGGYREPPDTVTVNGVEHPVCPDKGFAWNPGTVYR